MQLDELLELKLITLRLPFLKSSECLLTKIHGKKTICVYSYLFLMKRCLLYWRITITC